MSRLPSCCFLAVALATGAVARDASALEVTTTDFGSAVAVCQGALPAYEGALRKRPLAMQNEGASPAFVSCALPVENKLTRMELALAASTAAATVTCTAVNGFDGGTGIRYSTKSRALPAGGEPQILTWLPGDFGGSGTFPDMQVSVSCSLPPGVNLSRTWTDTRRYVGN